MVKIFFFFFQAEDGIRDVAVTGVQTCALPISRDRARLEQERAMAGLNVRFETLTPREREVMAFVVTGRLNKQIAADLGVSEITVKVHRGQVMRKMWASSLPDLTRMVDPLRLTTEDQGAC